ncbi:MAG: hypothetical protein ACK4MF_10215 [Hyphomicrobiaceae bacterium]
MDVTLTNVEIAMFDSIEFAPLERGLAPAALEANGEVAKILANALLERHAIAAHRLAFVFDAVHSEDGATSIARAFEERGSAGDAMLSHPAFLPYLRYFICGPDVALDVRKAFEREVRGLERGEASALARVARLAHAVPDSRRPTAEALQQLALEYGLGPKLALAVRKSVGPKRAGRGFTS